MLYFDCHKPDVDSFDNSRLHFTSVSLHVLFLDLNPSLLLLIMAAVECDSNNINYNIRSSDDWQGI
jgi:hypothetical protein